MSREGGAGGRALMVVPCSWRRSAAGRLASRLRGRKRAQRSPLSANRPSVSPATHTCTRRAPSVSPAGQPKLHVNRYLWIALDVNR